MESVVDETAPSGGRPRGVAQEPPLLLRVEEAARLLGLGRSKVFEMLGAGELPAVRIGRAVRISRAALERWVRERSSEPNGNDAPEAA